MLGALRGWVGGVRCLGAGFGVELWAFGVVSGCDLARFGGPTHRDGAAMNGARMAGWDME